MKSTSLASFPAGDLGRYASLSREVRAFPPNVGLNNFGRTTTSMQRHGCLTAYLYYFAAVSGVGVIALISLNFFGDQELPGWFLWATTLWGCANLVSAIALLKWKKWGFYALTVAALVMIPISLLAGLGAVASFASLVSVAIVYGLLQLNADGEKAWDSLR